MIDIKTILVPVDFSEPSKTAVNYGLSLALQFNASLVLTNIVPSSTALIYTFPTESFAFEREQVKHAKSTLPSLIPGEYRDRVNLRTIVKVGEVRSELLGIIHDEKIDLLVMGTHGRNVFEKTATYARNHVSGLVLPVRNHAPAGRTHHPTPPRCSSVTYTSCSLVAPCGVGAACVDPVRDL